MTILLGHLKINYEPLKPSGVQREELALAFDVSDFLLRRLDGSIESPDAWIEIAEGIGCRVIPFHSPGAGLGEYASTLDGGETACGVITFNTASTKWMQVATLVHEISHHVLVLWEIVPPTTTESICQSSGAENDNMAHRIARIAEELVLA